MYLVVACVCTMYICEYKLQLVHDKLNWISTALIEYETTASIQSMLMIAQHKACMCFPIFFHFASFTRWRAGVLTKMCIVCIDDVEHENFNKFWPKKTNHIVLAPIRCGTMMKV